MKELFKVLQEMNWEYGRGDVESVTCIPVRTIQPSPYVFRGIVTRRIPTTQSTGFTEDRKFVVRYSRAGTVVSFLGHRRSLKKTVRSG